MLRLILAFVLSLWSLPAVALCNGPGIIEYLTPDEQRTLDQLVAQVPYNEGLFWEATRGDQRVSIIGTMHLPDDRLGPLLARVMPTLTEADILLVEATLEDQSDLQEYIAARPDLITITEGGSLIDRLDAETWAAIAQAVEARGMPAFMAAKMQPWFLAMTLSMPPCASTAMQSGTGGLDNMLLTAADNKIEVQALEDWQVLLDFLMSGTFEEQVDDLRLGLVDPEIQDALIATLLDAYFAESPALGWHISRFTARFTPGFSNAQFNEVFDEIEQELLTKRNVSWIPVIEDAATTHDHVFAAFGAAHLIGENGVLSLLDRNGWAIERVTD